MVDLYNVWELVEDAINDVITGFFDIIIDDILGGLFTAFIGNAFNDISIDLLFMLFFSLFLFGFFWKYLKNPAGG